MSILEKTSLNLERRIEPTLTIISFPFECAVSFLKRQTRFTLDCLHLGYFCLITPVYTWLNSP